MKFIALVVALLGACTLSLADDATDAAALGKRARTIHDVCRIDFGEMAKTDAGVWAVVRVSPDPDGYKVIPWDTVVDGVRYPMGTTQQIGDWEVIADVQGKSDTRAGRYLLEEPGLKWASGGRTRKPDEVYHPLRKGGGARSSACSGGKPSMARSCFRCA